MVTYDSMVSALGHILTTMHMINDSVIPQPYLMFEVLHFHCKITEELASRNSGRKLLCKIHCLFRHRQQ